MHNSYYEWNWSLSQTWANSPGVNSAYANSLGLKVQYFEKWMVNFLNK